MKRFMFSLDKVLTYKEQVEQNLRAEHGVILQRVAAQEAVIGQLEEEFDFRCKKYEQEKQRICMIRDLKLHEEFLGNLLGRIHREKEALELLREEEEKKRQEVILAKTETSSIDRLKEKRLQEYAALVRKEDENLIEEFVANTASCRVNMA